jgi:hypothetical protein
MLELMLATRTTAAAVQQPSNASTVSLLHFDGNNGSTPIDEKGLVWTSNDSTTKVSTAQAKFGTGSLVRTGANALLTTPDKPQLRLTADFTIEFFYKPNSTTGRQVLLQKSTDIFCRLAGLSGSIELISDTGAVIFNSGGGIVANVWQHVAISRVGTTTYLFSGGQLITTYTGAYTFGNSSAAVTLGSFYDGSGGLYGALDEFRISNGGRYTTPFTPPAAAFVVD